MTVKLDMSKAYGQWSFNPEWGLRQGDPLSFFLFAICTEGLLMLIQRDTGSRKFHSLQMGTMAPEITHLLFVDDSVILWKAGNRSYLL